MSLEMVTLKNGAAEPKVAVTTTMMALQGLWDKGIPGICAVSDLVDRCRDPKHHIAGSELKLLQGFALVEPDGRIHDTVKNVVLSAVKGTGLELELGAPTG